MGTSVGARLQALHEGRIAEPLPEGLERASCGPAVKHLVHLAIHTADAGGSEADWRAWVTEHVPEVSPALLDDAEACMHGSGLWPWHAAPRPPGA